MEHLAEFVAELNELFGGFRERAIAVAKAFRSPDLAYVLVTSAAPAAIDEVSYFAARLRAQDMRPDAVVVNRLQPNLERVSEAALSELARELGLEVTPELTRAVLQAAEDDRTRAEFEAGQLAGLAAALGEPPPSVFKVPVLAADVHDLKSLSHVARLLFA